MAQGGDERVGVAGGSVKSNPRELTRAKHVRGAVAMARARNPNSGDSEFFIMFDYERSLDGRYSLWGYVVEGMEYVDMIKTGNPAPSRNGAVDNPDRIIEMVVAADVQDEG